MTNIKNKRHQNKSRIFKPRDREEVNENLTHYESNPYDVKEFIERMMTLGYCYDTIVSQTVVKFLVKKNFAENIVKEIRASWIAYGELESDEKKAVMEQQLNHLFRSALEKDQLAVAAVAIKRKMELAGISTSSTGKNSVNCNVNVGAQGLTAEDILPPDLLKEREEKQKQAQEEIEKRSLARAEQEKE